EADELFVAAGAVVRQFTGGAWPEVGRFSSAVTVLEPWDRDGAGPLPPRLVGSAGPVVRVWDGAAWDEAPPVPVGEVTAASEFDGDGAGPARPMLVVAALRSDWTRLYGFEAGAWRELAGHQTLAPIRDMQRMDP